MCNEVSALLTVMNVQHSTSQSIAQGALTIDVVVLSQQVWPSALWHTKPRACTNQVHVQLV